MSDEEIMVPLNLRVPQALLDRAERIAAKLSATDPLKRPASRSDVVRAAIDLGLDALERDHGRKGRRR